MNKSRILSFVVLVFVSSLYILFIIFYVLRERRLSIAFVGDLIPHRAVEMSLKEGKELFFFVKSFLSNHDIVFGNLEAPFAEKRLKYKYERAFNCSTNFIKSIKSSGFNVLNIANNHIYDCRYKGFLETLENLKKYNFFLTGYSINKQPALTVVEKNNIRVGFIGITMLLNNFPLRKRGKFGVCYYRKIEKVLKYVRKYSKEVDFLIVSIHWGEEYDNRYKKLEIIAKKLFNFGADCIIGCHQHILLPIEYSMDKEGYKNIVAYGLGNFIANIGKEYRPDKDLFKVGAPRRSVIFTIELTKKAFLKPKVKNMSIIPVWIHNNYNDFKLKKCKSRRIFPVILTDKNNFFLPEKIRKREIDLIYKEIKWAKRNRP